MIISRLPQMALFHPFLWLIFHCINRPHLLYPSLFTWSSGPKPYCAPSAAAIRLSTTWGCWQWSSETARSSAESCLSRLGWSLARGVTSTPACPTAPCACTQPIPKAGLPSLLPVASTPTLPRHLPPQSRVGSLPVLGPRPLPPFQLPAPIMGFGGCDQLCSFWCLKHKGFILLPLKSNCLNWYL